MKGIILAGGSGTRLYPLTKSVSKQLLPVYDKPMVYYPLSTLLLAGIKDILVISTPEDIDNFEKLLGNGDNFGIKLSYKVQPKPEGLAQAFIIGEDFIGNDCCCMILGDNIFYGDGFSSLLNNAKKQAENGKATVFGYYVDDPERFGVVEIDKKGKPLSIVEKPKNPKSNYAVTGLYFYPKGVSEKAKKIKPSNRNEYEITSLNELYLKSNKLNVELLGRGYTWLDVGTMNSLAEATAFVKAVETLQGIGISVPEEIAYRNKWINDKQLLKIINNYGKSEYGKNLKKLLNDNHIHKKGK